MSKSFAHNANIASKLFWASLQVHVPVSHVHVPVGKVSSVGKVPNSTRKLMLLFSTGSKKILCVQNIPSSTQFAISTSSRSGRVFASFGSLFPTLSHFSEEIRYFRRSSCWRRWTTFLAMSESPGGTCCLSKVSRLVVLSDDVCRLLLLYLLFARSYLLYDSCCRCAFFACFSFSSCSFTFIVWHTASQTSSSR
jgi:hypothetical protein